MKSLIPLPLGFGSRPELRLGLALALCVLPLPGRAQAPADPQLQALLREALDRNPDLARARTLVEAEKERIPQARALPDPTLTLGLQNDGFQRVQVGRMETSYYQVMATQGLPWPGKRGLRGEIASLGVGATRAALERARLSLEADLKRAYYGLLLARGQLRLLEEQALLLRQAEAVTRTRYEVGQGTQADLLRAQLETTRLDQSRLALRTQERTFLAALNRLRGAAPGSPVETPLPLAEPPAPEPASAVLERAATRSPEIQAARTGIAQAERSLDLARLERRPDFALTAGYMPRGSLDPMWYAGVSISLPLWSGQKQQRAVAEQEMRRQAQGSALEGVTRLLAERTRERADQLEAALGSIRIYREALLIQSEASFQAALAQFEAGRAPFLGVLEALNGWTADRGGLLQALAQAQALQIAQEEFNLEGTPPISVQGLVSGPLAMGGPAPGTAPSRPGPAAQGGEAGPAMKSM